MPYVFVEVKRRKVSNALQNRGKLMRKIMPLLNRDLYCCQLPGVALGPHPTRSACLGFALFSIKLKRIPKGIRFNLAGAEGLETLRVPLAVPKIHYGLERL